MEPSAPYREITFSTEKCWVPQARPVVVFVAGQPCSGKTTLADLVHMQRRGGAVRVSRDLYKSAHEAYPHLVAANVR
ncbi:zeta toxin family protein [Streptomyces sp. VRA16 Mangrove soil]|uniref:zeta toxin family protein n=1 Tax=Streptomyces sp. VRA16 Mangrove soil TaxID=2817434 RepID=UPI0027DC69DF|nr:zeta toxin family protein [Streptomyces sp. VRA16 Mangrove soil]